MMLSLIAAMDRNSLIGVNGGLPWKLPADLRHFKQTTLGKAIIMGSTTWSTLKGPLPGRTNIVLSQELPQDTAGCHVARSLDEALSIAGDAEEVFIIGGASVYAQALPLVDRMYLTFIDGTFTGDTHFPEYDADAWHEISNEAHSNDADNAYAYRFVVYERKQK